MEFWKDIGVKPYEVSNFGNLRNCKTGRILKLRPSHRGYLKTNLSYNGKIKTVFIHRLVAQAFIPNPNNLPQVNHKDGNKSNNNVDNLEWCTCSDNMIHAVNIGLHTIKNSKPVYQKDQCGNIITVYPSVRQAEISIGCSPKCHGIRDVCNGKQKDHKGYYWSY